MALIVKDRVKQQTTTTGTGTYTLSGSFDSFQTFAEIGDGNTTYYCCTDGTDFEIGRGTFTASGTTLSREEILSSSNSGAKVNWSAGTRTIFCTQPADRTLYLNNERQVMDTSSANAANLKLQSNGTDGVLDIAGGGPNFIRFRDGSDYSTMANAIDVVYRTSPNDLLIERSENGNDIAEFGGDDGHVKLLYDGSDRIETTSSGTTVTGNITVTGTVDGRDLATDGTKLDGIEAGADVTDTANVTAAGALMDSEVTNLADVKSFDPADYATAAQGTTADAALPKAGGQMTGNITFSGSQTVDGRDLSADGTKLDGIESGATADQTKADIDALNIDAATLDSLDSTQFLRSDADDSFSNQIDGTTIELAGGVTYDPPGTTGTDTATDVGLALQSGQRIVMGDDGYIRTIIDAQNGQPLKFGQSGTGLFGGSEIYGGSVGVGLFYNTSKKLGTLTDGVEIRGDLYFEGATDDAYETRITAVDPTVDRTITLPDATGTVALENGNAVLLNTTTVSSGVSSVDFGSSLITDDFDNYLLVVEDLTVSAATGIRLRLGTANSADATASIYNQNVQWRGRALTSTTNNTQNFSAGGISASAIIMGGSNQDVGTAATQSANFTLQLQNLRSTTFHKTISGVTGSCYMTDISGTNSGVTYVCSLRDLQFNYLNTAAVNFLTIYEEDVSSQISGGTFSLYGLKT